MNDVRAFVWLLLLGCIAQVKLYADPCRFAFEKWDKHFREQGFDLSNLRDLSPKKRKSLELIYRYYWNKDCAFTGTVKEREYQFEKLAMDLEVLRDQVFTDEFLEELVTERSSWHRSVKIPPVCHHELLEGLKVPFLRRFVRWSGRFSSEKCFLGNRMGCLEKDLEETYCASNRFISCEVKFKSNGFEVKALEPSFYRRGIDEPKSCDFEYALIRIPMIRPLWAFEDRENIDVLEPLPKKDIPIISYQGDPPPMPSVIIPSSKPIEEVLVSIDPPVQKIPKKKKQPIVVKTSAKVSVTGKVQEKNSAVELVDRSQFKSEDTLLILIDNSGSQNMSQMSGIGTMRTFSQGSILNLVDTLPENMKLNWGHCSDDSSDYIAFGTFPTIAQLKSQRSELSSYFASTIDVAPRKYEKKFKESFFSGSYQESMLGVLEHLHELGELPKVLVWFSDAVYDERLWKKERDLLKKFPSVRLQFKPMLPHCPGSNTEEQLARKYFDTIKRPGDIMIAPIYGKGTCDSELQAEAERLKLERISRPRY